MAKGRNAFVCIVERSLGESTDDPEFWNPKMRAPHCFNISCFSFPVTVKSWGANLPGSPVIAANDPEERVTILMVWAGQWSDGTCFSPDVEPCVKICFHADGRNRRHLERSRSSGVVRDLPLNRLDA